MDDLTALETWAAPLLARLQPAERRALARTIARELRASQAQRIATQQAPDGAAYTPRKPQKTMPGQQVRKAPRGAIRAAMFLRLKSAKYLRATAAPQEAAVGFAGRAARIARVHQEGLRDVVKPGGPQYQYPARPLLGLTDAERDRIADLLLRHLGP
jgi:phage virion morphogenesis protein